MMFLKHDAHNVVIHCAFEALFAVWQKRRSKIGRSRKFHDGRVSILGTRASVIEAVAIGRTEVPKRVLNEFPKDEIRTPVIPGKIDCARANTYRGEKCSELCHILRLISLCPFSRLRDVKTRTDKLGAFAIV